MLSEAKQGSRAGGGGAVGWELEPCADLPPSLPPYFLCTCALSSWGKYPNCTAGLVYSSEVDHLPSIQESLVSILGTRKKKDETLKLAQSQTSWKNQIQSSVRARLQVGVVLAVLLSARSQTWFSIEATRKPFQA